MSAAPPAYSNEKEGQVPPGATPYPPSGPYPPAGSYGPPAQGYPPQGYPPQGYPPQGPPQGYPPQGHPPGAYGQPPVHGTTTVVIAPGYSQFSELPVRMTCNHCSQEITTSTMYENGTLTWVACGVLLLFGCWLGCCLIPLCIDGCKDVVHTCPNCRQIVGRYKRM